MADLHPGRRWIDHCGKAQDLRGSDGVQVALEYLIGRKLRVFAVAAESDPTCSRELPAFVAHVRTIFEPEELAEYFASVERARTSIAGSRYDRSRAYRTGPVDVGDAVDRMRALRRALLPEERGDDASGSADQAAAGEASATREDDDDDQEGPDAPSGRTAQRCDS